MSPESERPEVATLVTARRTAAARYERARPLLRQALSLAKTYMDDGAPISAYQAVLRACAAVLEHEAQAGPGPWQPNERYIVAGDGVAYGPFSEPSGETTEYAEWKRAVLDQENADAR